MGVKEGERGDVSEVDLRVWVMFTEGVGKVYGRFLRVGMCLV